MSSIAVVIPCFKVQNKILQVLGKIPKFVNKIYVIDDCCPNKSGILVQENFNDDRIQIIFHTKNQGVGGAMISGYKAALNDKCDIIVKLDGDGQMNPESIPFLIQPILDGVADYVKGNRFFFLEELFLMPRIRLFGNIFLSFLSKFASGYWNIFDPTNGFTAIHGKVLSLIPLDKINKGYLFESDILFRLSLLRACVVDFPMKAHYADETSSLRISKTIFPFFKGYFTHFVKRIFYNYFLKDFSFSSISIIFSIVFLIFGFIFGISSWLHSVQTGILTTPGQVMIAALPLIFGLQFLLSFINFDISNVPKYPIHKLI